MAVPTPPSSAASSSSMATSRSSRGSDVSVKGKQHEKHTMADRPYSRLAKHTGMAHRISTLMRVGVLMALAFATVVLFSIRHREPFQTMKSQSVSRLDNAGGASVTLPLKPQVQLLRGGKTEVMYLLPPEQQQQQPARGVLIFFHGCTHAGQDMFELPEDRLVALEAIRRGLAVLSPTSANRASGCWSHRDADGMDRVVDEWMNSVKLPLSLPRMGMGASSGGSFLFFIHKTLNLKSMASYISPSSFSPTDLAAAASKEHPLPAVVFVHMPRDTRIAQSIADNQQALTRAGVPTQVLEVKPHPLTAQHCARRLPELGEKQCQALLQSIVSDDKEKKLLNPIDMTVLTGNRRGEWADALSTLDRGHTFQEKKLGELSQTSFSGHSWLWASMEEEVAVAYAAHEMTAEHRHTVLDFLMTRAGIPLNHDHGNEASTSHSR